MEKINLIVNGMTCESCVKHVKKALQSIAGVQKVEVNLELRTARLEGDFQQGLSPILATLEKVGYPAKVSSERSTQIKTKSSTCKSGSDCCCN